MKNPCIKNSFILLLLAILRTLLLLPSCAISGFGLVLKSDPQACVASVSARVRREKLGREQKKKKGMKGEGEGKEGNACPQTPRF